MENTKHVRPSWDEYFMHIAHTVGERATCDRGRTGCVIVRGKHIISTGYVGAPVGCKSCDDIGHEMNTVIHEDDTQSRHCIRTTHNEQNAIVQAARFGVSTGWRDFILYDDTLLYLRKTNNKCWYKKSCGRKRLSCRSAKQRNFQRSRSQI